MLPGMTGVGREDSTMPMVSVGALSPKHSLTSESYPEVDLWEVPQIKTAGFVGTMNGCGVEWRVLAYLAVAVSLICGVMAIKASGEMAL